MRLYTLVIALFVVAVLPISAKSENIPTFSVNGAWKVYQYGKESKSCVARATLDNGFTVALSGFTGRYPNRLSVDFSQTIFKAGKSYDTKISIPKASSKQFAAKAMSATVLAVSLDDKGALISDLENKQAMRINVQGNVFDFKLGGIKSALYEFKTCGAPQVKKTTIKTPAIKTTTEKTKKIELDYSKKAPIKVSQASISDSTAIIALKHDIEVLTSKNIMLEKQLAASNAALSSKSSGIDSKDWGLEEATLRYQESERQIKRLGEKLSRERLACQSEKEELEAMLFSPAITEQKQVAKLADLERELAQTKADAARKAARCDAKIVEMEKQLAK